MFTRTALCNLQLNALNSLQPCVLSLGSNKDLQQQAPLVADC